MLKFLMVLWAWRGSILHLHSQEGSSSTPTAYPSFFDHPGKMGWIATGVVHPGLEWCMDISAKISGIFMEYITAQWLWTNGARKHLRRSPSYVCVVTQESPNQSSTIFWLARWLYVRGILRWQCYKRQHTLQLQAWRDIICQGSNACSESHSHNPSPILVR